MKKDNALITQESTEVVLRKATNIMNRTNKILKNSKRELVTHPDVMMINGLMWQKETVEEKMDWYDAMEYAKNLRLGGYDDWRLPSIKELREVVSSCGGIIVDYLDDDWDSITDKNMNNNDYQDCYQEKGFASHYYWSSTTDKDYSSDTQDKDYSSYIHIVNFYNGFVHYRTKDYNFYVRCVRAGE